MEMTSFERLVASDPQRAATYAPRDVAAMILRVQSAPYARVLSWRAFKARVLAGFTTSCAAMALAIGALAGAGPSLTRLTFAASSLGAAPQKFATSASATVTVTGSGLVAPTRYLAGQISTSVLPLAAFTVTTPSGGDVAISTLAHALGVTLGPARKNVMTPSGSVNAWAARGEHGAAALVFRAGGVDLWEYLPNRGAASASATSGLDADALASRALAIVHALGNFEAGVPVVGTGTPFERGAPTNVVVPLQIEGHWSGLADSFVLDARGRVISARGALFALGPPVRYPLISPRAAIRHIDAQAAIFTHAVSVSDLPTVWSLPPVKAPQPAGTIRLTANATQYRILVDANGVAHALPIYQYVGRSANAREVVLDALALDPRFLVYEVHGGPGP